MQKKIQRILSLLVMFVVCSGSLSAAKPTAVRAAVLMNNTLVSQTIEYMTQNNIYFERAGYEYTDSDGRRVYTVISQDLTEFSFNQPFQKTVAVMNVISTDGTAGIYVSEASFSQDTVTYELKRNGQMVTFAQVNVILPQNPILLPNPNPAPSKPNRPWCPGDLTPARIDQLLKDALDSANKTCRTQKVWYRERCGISVIFIKPTFPQCRRTSWADSVFEEMINKHTSTYGLILTAPLSNDFLTEKIL